MIENEFIVFQDKTVQCVFGGTIKDALQLANKHRIIILTDDQLLQHYSNEFSGHQVISILSGEQRKQQETVDNIINQLFELEVDKSDFIIGIGGGVVSDIAGYVASIYKRGMKLGLVPSSLLGMVDASLGGKNGINFRTIKNMIGTIYQPDFIVYDFSLLQTLPEVEWKNGFAEIIKHSCIKDEELFKQLENYSIEQFRAEVNLLSDIVKRNVAIKAEIVVRDVLDKSDRKLLNFGHTFGHAIEHIYNLPHGFAVAIGMVSACKLSEKIGGFSSIQTNRIIQLLQQYGLPVHHEIDHSVIMDPLKKDKKRNGENIDFVLLDSIGKAHAESIPLQFIEQHLQTLI